MSKKSATFKLMDVIDAIESASEDFQYFANTQTGEIGCYIDPLISGEEIDEDAFESDEWISMPDSFDRDDWRIMRDYAYALGGVEGEELLDAIHGHGAFRAFRRSVERMGLLQSWFAYKDERICELAIKWLGDNACAWQDNRHENLKRDWRDLLPAALRALPNLTLLDRRLSVCKYAEMPEGLLAQGFFFAARTDDEVSIVCETQNICDGVLACEDGWRVLKVQGPLEFSLIGVLARISSILAEAEVPLLAFSTFDTDYILVKDEALETAIQTLREQGIDVDE